MMLDHRQQLIQRTDLLRFRKRRNDLIARIAEVVPQQRHDEMRVLLKTSVDFPKIRLQDFYLVIHGSRRHRELMATGQYCDLGSLAERLV